ncbi:cold shock domain-containing protein [Lysobacter sp. BMK333-48F3]|uniref:cold shock domain-containing protein n=1 Tax=Lysobacter sp. BMK333-48F3 TaxID=2867962 RepID=UPI001C8CDFD8|nr:cold shock domain-containing protein [Lysobacter sp. BMK333-48F3]MBX9399927.1 cold shock domain-containing protein [Lysobacter sp. BMK333-48F3]
MARGDRVSGTLVRWNDERGFGFLAPDDGGPQVFLHISALAADSPRPLLNERFSFDTVVDRHGKLSAAQVRRPHESARATARPHKRRPRAGSEGFPWSGALLVLIAIGGAGWYARDRLAKPSFAHAQPTIGSRPARADYACDGRTHCSQMRSCAEARYFLAHCPNVQMDGNGDGDPCEQQWCN